MAANRLGVAGGVDQRLVPEPQAVPAVLQAPRLQQTPNQRHDMPHDLVIIVGCWPLASDVVLVMQTSWLVAPLPGHAV